MSSEILRDGPLKTVAPALWRVVHGSLDGETHPAAVAQKLEQKFQEGKQRGLSESLAIARQESDAQLQPVLDRLAQSIVALSEARQSVREETAADLVRLSIAIASRILHREITLDPDAIHGLLKAAFDKARAREVTRVLLHPAHEEAVRSFVAQAASPTPIEIVADPRLECGAIRLETAHGQFDASIDTQLKEIERGLADRMDH
jgi:flagellar assembly protein FliH